LRNEKKKGRQPGLGDGPDLASFAAITQTVQFR